MATYNTSVTSSINYIPFNLSASEGLTLNIDNPDQGSSYVVLETRRNQDGFYDENTPKNAQGTYTLNGVTYIVSDDYKTGFVVPPGGGTASFDNTNYVSGSDFRVVGTAYKPFYDLLLDRWPNSAAAYSLRRLNSYYDGPAIRVRRSLDDAETNIGFSGLQLDTTTLTNFTNNPGTALPGDYGDGPAAAYSLRYVVSSYTGPVIKVRRSSDDTEQDFTPSQITDGTLESFCGAGNGFVSVWYDQSGNGYHAIQTSDASQPQIVSSGSTITDKGKVTIDYTIGNVFLYAPNLFTSGNACFIGVSSYELTGSNIVASMIDTFNDGYEFFISTFSVNNSDSTIAINDTNLHILFGNYNGNTNLFSRDGIATTTSTTTTLNFNGRLEIGSRNNQSFAYSLNGHISELVIYNSDQSSNRTDIESNINNYYNIFPFDAYVETWYDQSGNGNHASQTTAANQPQIVSSGSVITKGSQPSILFDGIDDELTNASLIDIIDMTLISVLNSNNTSQDSVAVQISRQTEGHFSQGFGNLGTSDAFGTRSRDISIISKGKNGVGTSQLLAFQYGEISVSNNLYVNSIEQTASIGARSSIGVTNFVTIGSRGGIDYLNGNYAESIVYLSDQSSNRPGIEADINSHYKIY